MSTSGLEQASRSQPVSSLLQVPPQRLLATGTVAEASL
jgi:hypothetical protein